MIAAAYLTHFWYEAWCHGKQVWFIYFPAKAPYTDSPTSTQDAGYQQLSYLKKSETVSRLKAFISLEPRWLD